MIKRRQSRARSAFKPLAFALRARMGVPQSYAAAINSDIQGCRMDPSQHPLPLSWIWAMKRTAQTEAMFLTTWMRQNLSLLRRSPDVCHARLRCRASKWSAEIGGSDGGELSVLKLAIWGLARPASHYLALRVVSKLLRQTAARTMFLHVAALELTRFSMYSNDADDALLS